VSQRTEERRLADGRGKVLGREDLGDREGGRVAARTGRARWRAVALVLAPLVLFALLLASGLGRNPRELPDELVRQRAPTFSLSRIDAEGTVDLADLGGQVVVVNFWASWCVPCREEHPALEAAWDRYRDRGVVVVGVLFEDTAEGALAFREELGGDWPLVEDPGGRTAIAYGVYGIPETFVIAPDGTIAGKRVGPIDYAWLTGEIEGALRTKEAP
jgi:cytochrome c biogenesis protein CcmG/thiol:disulfide interchange protein DsbE